MYKLGIHCGRWRSYDVIFFWLQLEWVYSTRYPTSPGYPFCDLLVRRRGRAMFYLVEVKTVTKQKQIFVHEPD